MPDFHSRISPSSLQPSCLCPARAGIVAASPRTSNRDADLGTDAHELGAMCLTVGAPAAAFIGKVLPNGNIVDDEMAEFVQEYVDFANGLTPSVENDVKLLVEEWVDLDPWLGEKGGGTSDLIVLDTPHRVLHVGDLKYGKRLVDAKDNWQMQAYALGAMDKFGLWGKIDTVWLHIIQPRNGGVSSWCTTPENLQTFGNHIKALLEITRQPNPPRIAGEKQCLYCPALGRCEEHAMWSAETVFGEVATQPHTGVMLPPAPVDLSNDQLATILNRADMIKKWLDAVQAESFKRMSEAERLPGWKLVQGKKGNRKWAEGKASEVAALLKSQFGLATESIYSLEMLSPSKILDLPEVKKNKAALNEYITQSEGSITMAPESDKRPAVALDLSAEAVFSIVQE